MRKLMPLLLAAMAVVISAASAHADDMPHKLTLALQGTGTVKWELAAMKALGIDKKHNLALTVNDVTDSAAGQIALQAGQADLVVTDFVWVSLQRHQGNMFTMVPHSLAVGGLMVDPSAGIRSIADLKGKTLAVSGSPADKTYVILAAYYNKKTGGNLTTEVSAKFGAPPLVNQLFTGGQAQASLNLWNWNARAKLAGKTELVSVAEMLGALGVTETPPLLGWVFSDATATRKATDLTAFLDASFETKQALIADDSVWDQIRPVMNVGDNSALFKQLRDDYRAGIVRKYSHDEIKPATDAFALLAKFGGTDIVGDATDIAEGTFWKGYQK